MDAYIIRDDYDQTTLAVVMGAKDGKAAMEAAISSGLKDADGGVEQLYAVGPIHVVTIQEGDKGATHPAPQ